MKSAIFFQCDGIPSSEKAVSHFPFFIMERLVPVFFIASPKKLRLSTTVSFYRHPCPTGFSPSYLKMVNLFMNMEHAPRSYFLLWTAAVPFCFFSRYGTRRGGCMVPCNFPPRENPLYLNDFCVPEEEVLLPPYRPLSLPPLLLFTVLFCCVILFLLLPFFGSFFRSQQEPPTQSAAHSPLYFFLFSAAHIRAFTECDFFQRRI